MGRFWWPADGAPSRVRHCSAHRLLLPILLFLPFTPPRCFFSVLLSVPLNISWSLAYQNSTNSRILPTAVPLLAFSLPLFPSSDSYREESGWHTSPFCCQTMVWVGT